MALKDTNKITCVLPPDNGCLEIEFGEGTRFSFLAVRPPRDFQIKLNIYCDIRWYIFYTSGSALIKKCSFNCPSSPVLVERKVESLSLLSLFRELRNPVGELKNNALKELIRIECFQLYKQNYRRPRQANIDVQRDDLCLSERDRPGLFDSVSGASVVFK